jgi:hypothetical protein
MGQKERIHHNETQPEKPMSQSENRLATPERLALDFVRQNTGQPLTSEIRATVEPFFGHSFTNTRIHADGQAASIASNLNARAITIGNEIVFNQREYQPETPDGQALLVHELTHAVQNSRFDSTAPKAIRTSIGDASEREADTSSQVFRAHQSIHVGTSPTGVIAAASNWWIPPDLAAMIDAGKKKPAELAESDDEKTHVSAGKYVAGATGGAAGAIEKAGQRAYEVGLGALKRDYDGPFYRAVETQHEKTVFDPKYSAGKNQRSNPKGEQILYGATSPSDVIAEAYSYDGMNKRTLVEGAFTSNVDVSTGHGGIADLTSAARENNLESALRVKVGGKGAGPLARLIGHHPYSLNQQAAKGAKDNNAAGILTPSASHEGDQLNIFSEYIDKIEPRTAVGFDEHQLSSEPVSAKEIVEKTKVSAQADKKVGPYSTKVGYLGPSVLGGTLGLIQAWHEGKSARQIGLNAVEGAVSAGSEHLLVNNGVTPLRATGIVSAVSSGLHSLHANTHGYIENEVDVNTATGNVVVDTASGATSAIASAAVGAEAGALLAGPYGAAVGAAGGFLVGMAANIGIGKLIDSTGASHWLKEKASDVVGTINYHEGFSKEHGFFHDDFGNPQSARDDAVEKGLKLADRFGHEGGIKEKIGTVVGGVATVGLGHEKAVGATTHLIEAILGPKEQDD